MCVEGGRGLVGSLGDVGVRVIDQLGHLARGDVRDRAVDDRDEDDLRRVGELRRQRVVPDVLRLGGVARRGARPLVPEVPAAEAAARSESGARLRGRGLPRSLRPAKGKEKKRHAAPQWPGGKPTAEQRRSSAKQSGAGQRAEQRRRAARREPAGWGAHRFLWWAHFFSSSRSRSRSSQPFWSHESTTV